MWSGASPWLQRLADACPGVFVFWRCRIPGSKKTANDGARNDGIAAAKTKVDGKERPEV
jgi:hypothetical protein